MSSKWCGLLALGFVFASGAASAAERTIVTCYDANDEGKLADPWEIKLTIGEDEFGAHWALVKDVGGENLGDGKVQRSRRDGKDVFAGRLVFLEIDAGKGPVQKADGRDYFDSYMEVTIKDGTASFGMTMLCAY